MSNAARGYGRLFLLLGLYLALGVAYSLVVPPFETPDELFHHAFARHIAQGGGLPVQDARSSGPWAQEGSQAPLYYLLVGGLTRGIDQNDFDALTKPNPRANIGDPYGARQQERAALQRLSATAGEHQSGAAHRALVLPAAGRADRDLYLSDGPLCLPRAK